MVGRPKRSTASPLPPTKNNHDAKHPRDEARAGPESKTHTYIIFQFQSRRSVLACSQKSQRNEAVEMKAERSLRLGNLLPAPNLKNPQVLVLAILTNLLYYLSEYGTES